MLNWQQTAFAGPPMGVSVSRGTTVAPDGISTEGITVSHGTTTIENTHSTWFLGFSTQRWTVRTDDSGGVVSDEATNDVTASWLTTETTAIGSTLAVSSTYETTTAAVTSTALSRTETTTTSGDPLTIEVQVSQNVWKTTTATPATTINKTGTNVTFVATTTVSVATTLTGTKGTVTNSTGGTQWTTFATTANLTKTFVEWTSASIRDWMTTYPCYLANQFNEVLWVFKSIPDHINADPDTVLHPLTELAKSTTGTVTWIPVTTLIGGYRTGISNSVSYETTTHTTVTDTGTVGSSITRETGEFTMPGNSKGTEGVTNGGQQQQIRTVQLPQLIGDSPNATSVLACRTTVNCQGGSTNISWGYNTTSEYTTISIIGTDTNTSYSTVTIFETHQASGMIQGDIGVLVLNNIPVNTLLRKVAGWGPWTETVWTTDASTRWLPTTVTHGQNMFRAPDSIRQTDPIGSNLNVGHHIYFPEELMSSCQLGILTPVMEAATITDDSERTWNYQWTTSTKGPPTLHWTERHSEWSTDREGTTGKPKSTTGSGVMAIMAGSTQALYSAPNAESFYGRYGVASPAKFGGVGEWSTDSVIGNLDTGLWHQTVIDSNGNSTETTVARTSVESSTFGTGSILALHPEVAMFTAGGTDGIPGVFCLPRNDLWTVRLTY